jgi:ferric-dicitrate binding protein FerR (iron transport regulator)
VESGNNSVQVLGTQFNWMHYPGVPDEITLLSGKIRLSGGNVQRELAPGERAVIHEESPIRVRVQRMKNPKESVAWMGARPSIEFDSTDLYIVIHRMAQYYGVGFYVDPALRSGSPVTGTLFLRQSLEQNIAWMADILKGYARIEEKNGMIEVTR